MEAGLEVIKKKGRGYYYSAYTSNSLWFSFHINLGVETQGQVGITAIKNMSIHFIPSNHFEEFWLYYPPQTPPLKISTPNPLKD